MDNSLLQSTHFSFFRKGLLAYIRLRISDLEYTVDVEYDISPDNTGIAIFLGGRGIVADMTLDKDKNVTQCSLTRIEISNEFGGEEMWEPPPEDKHRPSEGLLKILDADVIWLLFGATAEA